MRIDIGLANPSENDFRALDRRRWCGKSLEANTLALALIASGSLVAPYGAAHQLMLAVVGMSLIGAAGYTMRTLPRAAIGYIAIISVGLMAALLGTGTVVAIATCILILATSLLLCRMALTAYSLFVVRIVRERSAIPRSKP